MAGASCRGIGEFICVVDMSGDWTMQWTLEALSALRKKKQPKKCERISTGSESQSPKVKDIESASSETGDHHGKSKKGKRRQVLTTDVGFASSIKAASGFEPEEEAPDADPATDMDEVVDESWSVSDSDSQDDLGVAPLADCKQVDKRARTRFGRSGRYWNRFAKSGLNDMAVADFLSLV
jgi:hypothetical protein